LQEGRRQPVGLYARLFWRGITAHRCDSEQLPVGRELPEPTPEAKAKSLTPL